MVEWHEMVLRLAGAAAIGGLIGLNRDLHHKPSGLRTLALVGLGAALVTLSVLEATPDPAAAGRVVQGVITGIGFLGAGVIVREATSRKVHGLTTAAATWVTACLGCACGLGAWRPALAACGVAGVILLAGGPFERMVHRRLAADTDTDSDTDHRGDRAGGDGRS